MRTFIKIMLAAIVATGMVLVMAQHGVGFKACTVVYFFVGILTAALLGAFDAPEKRKQEKRTIRRYVGKNYGQAAVFIGTACVFIGTPDQCADVADDYWHYAEPAEVRMLDGEHDLEVL